MNITIKRRLFVSNILMIALPIVLTILTFIVISLTLFRLTGEYPSSIGRYRATYIREDNAPAYLQKRSYTQVEDIQIYQSQEGKYLFVFSDKYEIPRDSDSPAKPFALYTALIVIVYITNWALTRILFRSIMTPIEILVNGVHEIGDGNLAYRIQYNKKDEFLAVCNDFNQMADHLQEMVEARQRDEESRRELIAGISHDLRTPLTSIKTYVEGIQLGMASTPERLSHYLQTITNKTKDLEHIINQLFLFSKLDVGEFPMRIERVDIGRWLYGFIESIAEEYEKKGMHIAFQQNVHGAWVDVDRVQLQNVLLNLLSNSIKYSDKEEKKMQIFWRREGKNLLVSLLDNGPGVPEEDLEKLFSVFYREDKARSNTSQGSGLGLAISAKIMERLGGGITACNPPDGGLCITLSLPVQGGEDEKDTHSGG